jgi:hypothetical protein
MPELMATVIKKQAGRNLLICKAKHLSQIAERI